MIQSLEKCYEWQETLPEGKVTIRPHWCPGTGRGDTHFRSSEPGRRRLPGC